MNNSDRIYLRLDGPLKADIVAYARRNGTTVTAIVISYFQHLLNQEQQKEAARVAEVEQI